ncbi:MAG: aminotransferase class I/II-fold pyridoxal phosphate-dependent enzyme [Chlamydiia bacterium]|nr:aminotransferase class I/II-fold pyridoxal phosphate-dependent enzyme [Chlamydiia bacterium]
MNVKTLQTSILVVLFHCSFINAEVEEAQPVIYLQPNTTQLFTELYQAYGLQSPPKRTFFESALYLDQSTPPSILPLQPSNAVIFDHADQVLSQFHARVKDLELYIDPSKPKPFFYTATGSKHLIVALVFAIVKSEPDTKFAFAEQVPYYSGHPNAVTGIFDYPNARFIAFENPSEIKLEPDEELVEIVTSPNNPDGKFREPQTDAEIIMADFVFASSAFGRDGTGYVDQNIEWLRKARANGKHVFSFNSASKQFGKTGARCGYMWYPLYDEYAALIFKKFYNFISCSTVAGSSTGLADFLDLIKAFIDLSDTGISLRKDAHESLISRHELVEKELLTRYPGSTVISIPGSPTLFAKINDPRIPNERASDVILKDLNVAVNNGEPMGETNDFVRLNLSGYSILIAQFLNRLAGENKYTEQDVLTLSTHQCAHSTICSNGSSQTEHFVNPGDCNIEVDASKGPITVWLPKFFDYLKSEVVTIQKIDSSENPVVIKSDSFIRPLEHNHQNIKVQWTQPDYSHGHWNVIE